MKYLSIDLETSRLNPKTPDGILMASFVVEDTENQIPVNELPHLTLLIDQGEGSIAPWSRVAISMNAWILMAIEINSKTNKKQTIERLRSIIATETLDRAVAASESYQVVSGAAGLEAAVLPWFDEHFGPKSRINVAGKNAAGFDIPFLPPRISSRFRARVIDPGTLFVNFKTDSELPAMDQCLARSGVEMIGTAHDALADARATIAILRSKY